MKPLSTAATAAAAINMLMLMLLASPGPANAAEAARRPYIVELAGQPVASYDGGVAGLAATRPAPGARLNLASPAVLRYAAYLDARQAAARALVGAAPVLYQYKVVLNGFAALLSDAEVRQLQASNAVRKVTPDQRHHLLTSYTPTFLGLDQPDGLWSRLGGKEHAGDDVIVGVIDSGVWPENPSFSDRVDSKGVPTFASGASVVYGAPPAGWQGSCQSGEGFRASDCNRKLIGARYFDASRLAQTELVTHWSEFRSPRDSIGGSLGQGGHGTHTASTAAGNHGVPAQVGGIALGTVSGMAPRARVAVYKICWSYDSDTDPTGAENGCWSGDAVAAVESAVTDGVHVLNYSISGGESPADPVEQAFLHAANAGVFVAASAGNSGPANAVAHVSPWLATVAASTHDRQYQATVTLGDGRRFTGASINPAPLPQTALIRAQDAGLPGADPARLALCYSAGGNDGLAVLDPAKVAGKIVTCLRGENARVDKSLAVAQAGGAGMILLDNGAGLVADVHAVPTVHVRQDDGQLIDAYAAAGSNAGASAALSRFVTGKSSEPAPMVAGFSSRGPNRYDPNLLKPDLAAPGVDILAGVTPELRREQRRAVIAGTLVPPPAWAFYQGTSMASPHVAGVAALLRQRHPHWSPAAIKSALMTSAVDTYPDTQTGAARGILPWGQGAGHIAPNRAVDPGLLYDAGMADYQKYLCGLNLSDDCAGGSIAGYNLNLASITLDNVPGALSVTRRVTNAGATAATYEATASISGYRVAVEPSTLTLAPGASSSFTVRLTRTTAPDNVWQFGTLLWRDGAHVARSPLAARSGPLAVMPEQVVSDRASGNRLLGIRTAFGGRPGVATGGLTPVARSLLRVGQAEPGSIGELEQIAAACNNDSNGVRVVPVTFPADTVVARFELFQRDTGGGAATDLDLAVLNGDGELVGTSLYAGSDEVVALANPRAGAYRVCVLGYALGGAPAQDFTLSSAVVTRSDHGGNLQAAAPGKVYPEGSASMALSWSGLATGQRYLGGVQLLTPDGDVAATTIVAIELAGRLPLASPTARRAAIDRGR